MKHSFRISYFWTSGIFEILDLGISIRLLHVRLRYEELYDRLRRKRLAAQAQHRMQAAQDIVQSDADEEQA